MCGLANLGIWIMDISEGTETRELSTTDIAELLKEMQEKVASGTHWYLALLETIGKWKFPEEEVARNIYRYLIGGEAFDWLLLVSRLSQELNGNIPQEEKEELLFHGREPLAVTQSDFKTFLGPARYKAYLNYYYGVEVEEALISAVEEEVMKEKKALGFTKLDEEKISDEAFKRLYHKGFNELLAEYRQEKALSEKAILMFYEWKEFIYWLFQLRCRFSDKARCASDTKKALQQMQKQRTASLYRMRAER